MALNEQADLPDSLKLRFDPIRDQLRFYRQADGKLIREIRCGLIYIMAFWSAYAFKALPMLVKAIQDYDPKGKLQVCIVDNDGIQEWDRIPQIRGLDGGWGELIAVYDGKVVGTSGFGFQPESYGSVVRALLEWNPDNPGSAPGA